MCNYLSPYSISCLSDCHSTTKTISQEKAVKFTWDSTYDKAFKQAKLHAANAATLKYFDPLKPIVLECDASCTGIGGILLQDGQPVTFISQALTDTQKMLFKHRMWTPCSCGHCGTFTPLPIWMSIYHSHWPLISGKFISEVSEWYITMITMSST